MQNNSLQSYLYPYTHNTPTQRQSPSHVKIVSKTWSGGALKESFILVNGKKHGLGTEWYPPHLGGGLAKRVFHVHGIRHGTRSSWFCDGRAKEDHTYENGTITSRTVFPEGNNPKKVYVYRHLWPEHDRYVYDQYKDGKLEREHVYSVAPGGEKTLLSKITYDGPTVLEGVTCTDLGQGMVLEKFFRGTEITCYKLFNNQVLVATEYV